MATLSEALAIALAHHQAGRLELAEEIYRRVLAVEPDQPDALHLLGMIAHQTGQPDVAVERIRRAIAVYPSNADYYNNLAAILQSLGRSDEAIACYRRGLEWSPELADLHFNLGNTWRERLNLPEAIACYQRALQLNPGFAQAHNNLGIALRALGDLDEAAACYQRALELNPDDARACNNLGDVAQLQGKTAEAIGWYQRAVRLQPDFSEAHSNLLLALEYHGASPGELASAYSEYDRRHAWPLKSTWRPHRNARDSERVLRLGFVSADFRHHSVGYSFLRVLECLPKEECQLVCYSNRSSPRDAFTERFEAAAGQWREILGLSDDAVAEQIRDHGIDILFDLCGHFAGTRLLVFARKPAPIQIGWTGPTGLTAMDYLLADRHLVPADAEIYFPERVLRMPDAYTCFEPPPEAPAIGPLPAFGRGSVTFGTLNHLAKISPQTIRPWSEILRRVPASRLILRHMFSTSRESVHRRLLEAFGNEAIDPRRIEVVGRAPYAQRLDLYRQIDIALDPSPFSGATTTYEALWMGVPVITCPGPTYYRRMCLPHLRTAGLDDLVAVDLPDYIDRAVALAQDLPRLAALRAGLRARVAESPLYDGRRYATNLMSLLRDVWRDWCKEAHTP